jgi:hypothetical protein
MENLLQLAALALDRTQERGKTGGFLRTAKTEKIKKQSPGT